MEVGEGVECNPLDEKRLESQQWYLKYFKDENFMIISEKNGINIALKITDVLNWCVVCCTYWTGVVCGMSAQ